MHTCVGATGGHQLHFGLRDCFECLGQRAVDRRHIRVGGKPVEGAAVVGDDQPCGALRGSAHGELCCTGT